MPLEDDIHNELISLAPEIIALLEAGGFWDLPEGPFDPTEFISSIPKRAKEEYKAESQAKNSRIWDLLKAALIGQAIGTGVDKFSKAYPRVAPKNPKDFADEYIKKHGGEFIKGMGRTDQQRLVNFIWYQSGQNERPMKKMIAQQPYLQKILDRGKHRTETIVRTEKHRATSYGTHKSALFSGFTKKSWHTAGDKRVRDPHRSNASQGEIPIDDAFQNGEEYPSQNTINCRCRLSYA